MRSGCRRRSWTVLRRSFSIPSYKRINTPERLLLRAVPSAPHLLQTSSSNPHSLVNLQIVESLTTPAFGSQPFDRWRTGFAGRVLANCSLLHTNRLPRATTEYYYCPYARFSASCTYLRLINSNLCGTITP